MFSFTHQRFHFTWHSWIVDINSYVLDSYTCTLWRYMYQLSVEPIPQMTSLELPRATHLSVLFLSFCPSLIVCWRVFGVIVVRVVTTEDWTRGCHGGSKKKVFTVNNKNYNKIIIEFYWNPLCSIFHWTSLP